MKLLAALGWSLMYTTSAGSGDRRTAWEAALDSAEKVGDADYRSAPCGGSGRGI